MSLFQPKSLKVSLQGQGDKGDPPEGARVAGGPVCKGRACLVNVLGREQMGPAGAQAVGQAGYWGGGCVDA